MWTRVARLSWESSSSQSWHLGVFILIMLRLQQRNLTVAHTDSMAHYAQSAAKTPATVRRGLICRSSL
jgi:hypothetical protein